jgi:hypothetical protein
MAGFGLPALLWIQATLFVAFELAPVVIGARTARPVAAAR